jgi:hypothetical protein
LWASLTFFLATARPAVAPTATPPATAFAARFLCTRL